MELMEKKSKKKYLYMRDLCVAYATIQHLQI